MRRNRMFFVAAAAGLIAGGVAIAQQQQQQQDAKQVPQKEINKLVARILPTEGNNVRGVVIFTKEQDGVKMEAHLRGLKPNSLHGIHIHQYGDARSSDGSSAGGHYNPGQKQHALPPQDQESDLLPEEAKQKTGEGGEQQDKIISEQRHSGDMGNIKADEQGNATKTITLHGISLHGEEHPIIGRAVVVHGNPDIGVEPSGSAGPRIGLGIIGAANPEAEAPIQSQGG